MSTLIRWNPLREMATMQNMMDRLFEDTWRNIGTSFNNAIAFDVQESDNAYTLRTALPGLSADAINISLHENTLTVSGEIPAPIPQEGVKVHLQENFYGEFSRSITLPVVVDHEGVEAAYENGVLTLTLPKAPSAQPRRISISAGKEDGKALRSKN